MTAAVDVPAWVPADQVHGYVRAYQLGLTRAYLRQTAIMLREAAQIVEREGFASTASRYRDQADRAAALANQERAQ